MKNIDQQKQEQLKIGLTALSKCIKTKADVQNAFLRIDLGYISLIYGIPGHPKNKFKPGYGISHIIAKRNSENNDGLAVSKKLIDVLVYGTIRKHAASDKIEKIEIAKDGYLAILKLTWNGENIYWLLSGYKEDKKKL